MSWNQAREMARHGIEFGAHTCSHPRLDRVPARCTDEQILRSRDVIEGQLGRVIRHFAYPYGRISKHATTIVARSFYAGCGTSLGMVDSTSDPFALERVDARYVDPRLGLTSRRFGLYLTLLGPLRRGRSLIAGRAW
jgi:peptidoglycan/xylan/chitin deacetylase (PgdA/CDA1 family)